MVRQGRGEKKKDSTGELNGKGDREEKASRRGRFLNQVGASSIARSKPVAGSRQKIARERVRRENKAGGGEAFRTWGRGEIQRAYTQGEEKKGGRTFFTPPGGSFYMKVRKESLREGVNVNYGWRLKRA